MIVLTKENITDYLKTRMPDLDYSKPLIISAVGEGKAEDDGDGFLNYVFRVSDGKKKLIVKQGLTHGRLTDRHYSLPSDRGRREFDSMRLRKSIVPHLLPDLYFCDDENFVFVTEDVSRLKIIRFQLNKGIVFPKFATQAAEYLAKTLFYTSEYYLSTEDFRNLTVHFMNHRMRDIFDTNAFISKHTAEQVFGQAFDPQYEHFIKKLVFDPKVVLERYKLRHLFITKGEALVHGDFHTSNIFADQDEMKVIDMEYTFCGPLSYDLGYMQSHLLSQYASAAFRPFKTEQDRLTFQAYLLATMKEMYTSFCEQFICCWNQDAKEIYQNIPLLQEDFKKTILSEMTGFCGTSNMSRCSAPIGYPEYDIIEDRVQKHNATCLSMFLDNRIISRHEQYETIDEFINDIIEIERIYKSNITEW